jgi:hypothetical protein
MDGYDFTSQKPAARPAGHLQKPATIDHHLPPFNFSVNLSEQLYDG